MKQRIPLRWILGGAATAAAVLFIQAFGYNPAVDVEGWEAPRMMELYTPYCSSCQAMAPVVTALRAKCGPAVQVLQIDLSLARNEPLVDALNIEAIPTFIFIDEDGEEVHRLVGRQEEATLRKHLADVSDHRCPLPS